MNPLTRRRWLIVLVALLALALALGLAVAWLLSLSPIGGDIGGPRLARIEATPSSGTEPS